MRYLSIGRGRRGRMTVKALAGGLNLRALPSEVANDQLTAAVNLWWHDDVLCSRPALRVADAASEYGTRTYLPGADARFVTRQNGVALYTGEFLEDGTRQENPQSLTVRQNNFWRVCCAPERLAGWPGGAGDGTILFLGDGSAWAPLAAGGYQSLADMVYVPLLLTGGQGTFYVTDTPPAAARPEERNLLTPAFRACYTTDGEGRFFHLPVDTLSGSHPITVDCVNANGGTVRHVIPVGEVAEATVQSDGMQLHCSHARRLLWFTDDEDTPVAPPASGVSDGLTVTACTEDEDAPLIGQMRFGCFFGGANSGLLGGNRLFAGGNPLFPERIYWSAADQPLYFPASNYVAVGEPSQAVTAFGKQGERLIVFKEHEIYAASYMYRQADAELAEACFTLSPLHSEIGCDCPDTLRLCRNRLVWLTGEGKVYTLLAGNAYSGCTVRELSGMVSSALQKEPVLTLRAATAVCYEGWYLLAVGLDIWLFRYADTAFERLSSFSTGDELAQRGMTWYRWQFPVQILAERLVNAGGRVTAVDLSGRSYLLGGTVDKVLLPDDSPYEQPIKSSLSTGIYDMGRPDVCKTVREVQLEVGAREPCTVDATWLTDEAAHAAVRPVAVGARTATDTGFWRPCRWTPHTARTRRFGLRLSFEGAVAVGTLTVCYDMANETVKGDMMRGHHI